VFKRVLGDDAYPLDGELYDMMLLSQAWVQQRHGTPYVDPAQPRVAMSEAAALDWVRVYKRLIADHVATPLPLRASLGGAEKPTEQQPDWVVGRWAGNYTWDSVIALRSSTLDKQQRLALGAFPTLPGALDSGMFGRPTVMYAVSRHAEKNGRAEMAARLVNFLLTDREAAALLGRTRGLPSARGPYEQLKAAGALPPLEVAAHEQIRAQRESGRLKRPAPLFEHARLHKFMREVFETVAYGKTGDAEAARRLVVEGQALLQRIK
jgi:oligogalacturonide transport system substrate-binding protein